MNLKPINEQVVVMVGAHNGIGRETTLRFAERGATPFLISGESFNQHV